MKTVQDYYNILKGIESRVGITGVSGEILAQLLSQSLYFSEVENIAYSQEASLERAVNPNSKIQQCVDRMYSVFRGTCPRVILKIKPSRLFSWGYGDKLYNSNNFSLYYESYWDPEKEEFVDSEVTISAASGESYIIKCLMSAEFLTGTRTISSSNTTYVEFPWKDLSNDLLVSVDGSIKEHTRSFATHVENPETKVFDLTISDFGCRLYAPEIFKPNTRVAMAVHRYCDLSNFAEIELKNIKIKGALLELFTREEDHALLSSISSDLEYPGLIFIDASPRDALNTIHYKANRERYASSVYRSNSDLAYLLTEDFPEIVKSTTYKFTGLHSTVEEGREVVHTFQPSIQILEEEKVLAGSVKGEEGYKALKITGAPGVYTTVVSKVSEVGVKYNTCIVLSGADVYYEADNQFPLLRNIIKVTTTDTNTTSGKWTIVYSGVLYVSTNLYLLPTKYESDVLSTIEVETTHPLLYLFGDTGFVYDIILTSTETVIKYPKLDPSQVTNTLNLYYIPRESGVLLDAQQKKDFIERRAGYYITNTINIDRGTLVKAIVNLNLEIYSNSVSVEDDVKKIVDLGYSDQFDLNLQKQLPYMEALLLKVSNIKRLASDITISYQSETGEALDWETEVLPNLETTYFSVTHLLNTTIS